MLQWIGCFKRLVNTRHKWRKKDNDDGRLSTKNDSPARDDDAQTVVGVEQCSIICSKSTGKTLLPWPAKPSKDWNLGWSLQIKSRDFLITLILSVVHSAAIGTVCKVYQLCAIICVCFNCFVQEEASISIVGTSEAGSNFCQIFCPKVVAAVNRLRF